ncbi:MAG: hypothetical protein JO134_19875 [Xanthobacteraceae bacterium]|nr:hypothetical protein [Xanthobacteraceae bacterium]
MHRRSGTVAKKLIWAVPGLQRITLILRVHPHGSRRALRALLTMRVNVEGRAALRPGHVTDSGTKLGACLAGFGVAQMIDLGLDHHFNTGALVNLFPDWSDERFPLYVYYASRSHVPAKVRTFIDFIVESLGSEPGATSTRKPRTSVAA